MSWPDSLPPSQNEPEPDDNAGAPQIVRRRQRMVSRPSTEGEGPVVNRGILADVSRSASKPQTRRNRQLVGDLPDWDPLPPGEVTVSKSRPAP